MTDKSDILDRIDVRFTVDVSFDLEDGDESYHGKATFSITCGVYSGIPDKQNIADLINSRGIYDHDITDLSGTDTALTKERAAIMLNASGIDADEIDHVRLAEVLVDDETVAQSHE